MTGTMETRAAERGTVTWLHLSDLHACRPKTGWEAKGILDKLQEDFKKLQRHYGLTPDLIFFTGDAVFGQIGKDEGKSIKEQFKEAADLFEKIRTAFSPEVSKDNVFLVPGNHDVNRDNVLPMLHKGLDMFSEQGHEEVKKQLTLMIRDKDGTWKEVIRRLTDYRQFLEDNGFFHLLQDRDRLIYGHIRDIDGTKVGIVGLNSAWSCYKDSQKGKLWLAGHWQIETLDQLIGEADIKIALMHHPFNWFNGAEDPNLKQKLENRFNFFLHGHEHDVWVEELKNGFTTISAGACYVDSPKELGYNIVQWNTVSGSGKVWLRSYKSKGEGWIANLIPGKTSETEGVWKLGKDVEESKNGKEKSTEPDKEYPAKKEMEQDIPPDSPESRGIFGREKDIQKIAKAIKKRPLVGVYGMAGIGKSSVIKEVKRTPQFKDLDYVSCIVTRGMGLKELFRQLARALGCTDDEPKADFNAIFGGYDFSKLKTYAEMSTPVFIHLIDVHLFFEDYKLRTPGIKEFLEAIPNYYPDTYIILESRISLRGIFSEMVCEMFHIRGIDSSGMELYFKYPFKDDHSVSWDMNRDEKSYLFQQIGDHKKIGSAMPLAMMLLANVARGTNKHPVQVLKEHTAHKKYEKKLEVSLFNDLYQNVLNPAEQHMLRLCALYREDIPNSHENALNEAVKEKGVFWHLVQRCLLTASPKEEWFSLHTIIAQLTKRRIDKAGNPKQYWDDHDAIANAWLAQLKLSSQPSLPNIKAVNEAFYHLTESESYDRYYELSDKLLGKDVVPHLEQLSGKLLADKKYESKKHVDELLVRIEPNEAKYHRFLANTIEKIEGRGNQEALKHYKEAYKLRPIFPPHLNDLGRCLLAMGKPEEFISLIESIDRDTFQEATNNHSIAIYARCLDRVGREGKASEIRMEQIDSGARNPVFYTDEANYLSRKGNYPEAMEIIKKAEDNKCADEFILSVKATILEKSGYEEAASILRRQQIDSGVRNPVFYNDEANYLATKGNYPEAMEIIKKAEDNKCANEFILAIKATILEKSGDEEAASRLRRQQIDSGVRNPVFYADEANYLARKGNYPEAMEIIEKAEKMGLSNEYTRSIRKKIERGLEKE